MRHTFEAIGYQSGFYLSQLFSSARNNSSSSPSIPLTQPANPSRPSVPIFNYHHQKLVFSIPNFPNPTRTEFQSRDGTHMFLHPNHPNPPETRSEEQEHDIKWPNGLSFFNALTSHTDDAKLLFNHEGIEVGKNPNLNLGDSNMHNNANVNEFLSLDNHKFKRSFSARMSSSSSSASLEHHNQNQQQQQHQQHGEYRNSETGMYSDAMETFLDFPPPCHGHGGRRFLVRLRCIGYMPRTPRWRLYRCK